MKDHKNSQQTQDIQVVIVEDSESIVSCLRLQLPPYLKLIIFSNAEDALKYILNNIACVELVIIDHMLPGMSGMQLVSIIKKNPGLNHLRIILQSAYDCQDLIKEYKVQPDFYLQKPYTGEQMKNAIQRALGLKAM